MTESNITRRRILAAGVAGSAGLAAAGAFGAFFAGGASASAQEIADVPEERLSSRHSTTTRRVVFSSEGARLVGDLYVPIRRERGRRLPAIVVTGSWTTVRQQMPALYAERLAERGYLALAFDFRGYGDSQGRPRDYESPARKARDIHNAIGYLARHPAVDPDRIGGLAVCASCGYAAVNATADRRVRSLAMVAPWLHDATLVESIYGGPEGVQRRMTDGAAARRTFERTGKVLYVPAISTTDPDAAMYGDFQYYLDPNRGAIPQWGNRFAVMAWLEWLTFDPIRVAPEIATPTVLVHSEDAAIPDGARRFHQALRGPKNLIWTTGTQFDFYDQNPAVTTAVDAVDAHFRATL